MRDFRIFRQVRRTTSLKRNGVSAIFCQGKNFLLLSSKKIISYDFLLLTTHRNIDELCQHVTGRNARFSNFSPSSAKNVVETKKGINDIVSAQKNVKTGLSSEVIGTIFSCWQPIEILTNSVSTSPGEMRDFQIFRQVWRTTSLKRKKRIDDIVLAQKATNTVFSIKLFVTIFCCSQHLEILTNSVST